ncbi:MAG: carbon-nitrogen hydrolase family protein, partial [Bacteroidetes bacterium]|nr:carbon-nitrogen hydrolase family protein [Bacteroidota bacterium]
RGIQPARERLSQIAKTYSQTVLMSNCVGMADGEVCGGHSSIWDNEGELLIELNDQEEGLLILDTETGVVAKC